MGKRLEDWTAKGIEALTPGKHNLGLGLYCYVTRKARTDEVTRAWVMRYTAQGTRYEMGLGGYPSVSLKSVRDRLHELRRAIELGGNPKLERDAEREAQRAAANRDGPEAKARRTLGAVIARTFEAQKAGLKGEGLAGRWRSPLDTHVIPKLGDRDVETITAADIADTLRPIWHDKADVARKALQRTGKALAYARAEGLNVGRDITADARDILGAQLRTPNKIPAMKWQDVPAYYATLGDSAVDLCLRLVILTGVRSRPARFAHVDQFEGDLWTIPAAMMKGSAQQAQDGGNDFSVPLSPEAVAVIEAARPFAIGGHLFTGQRGKVISDMSMSARMRRDKLDARPHGFRSSLRTWADEMTRASYEAKETVLGHKVGGVVERSYARSDLIDQRRELLAIWGAYVAARESEKGVEYLDKWRAGGH